MRLTLTAWCINLDLTIGPDPDEEPVQAVAGSPAADLWPAAPLDPMSKADEQPEARIGYTATHPGSIVYR